MAPQTPQLPVSQAVPTEDETVQWLKQNPSSEPTPPPALAAPSEDETVQWLKRNPSTEQQQQQQQQQQPQTWGSYLASFVPSAETTLRVGGGIIGGAIGAGGGTILGTPIGGVAGAATGGAAGAAAGEALYHLMNTGANNQREMGAAQLAEDAANRIGNAAAGGALQESIGAVGLRPTAAASRALQAGATKQTINLLAPAGTAEKRAVQAAAQELSEQMPLATSRQGLLDTFNIRLNQATNALERAYNNVPTNIRYKTSAIAQQLQQSQDALLVNGKVPPGAQPQYDAYQELIDWFRGNPSMSLPDLRTNRQLWDRLVHWSRMPTIGSSQPAREAVYEEGANLVRRLINSTNPTIADLNHAASVWKTGTDVLERSATRDVGRSPVSVGDLILGGVGGAVGRAIGGHVGIPGGEEIGALLPPLARHVMSSPAWRTASINTRQLFIRALNSGVPFDRAITVLTKTGVGAKVGKVPMSVTPGPLPPNPPP